jgi:cell wall-associated NlpC family hydrolase
MTLEAAIGRIDQIQQLQQQIQDPASLSSASSSSNATGGAGLSAGSGSASSSATSFAEELINAQGASEAAALDGTDSSDTTDSLLGSSGMTGASASSVGGLSTLSSLDALGLGNLASLTGSAGSAGSIGSVGSVGSVGVTGASGTALAGEAATSVSDPRVQAMVDEANSLVGEPYVWGGGHSGWGPQAGYDCSGFVSAVLHAGGYLSSPQDTATLPTAEGIESGPGQYVTIYDRDEPGVQGHVIIDIAGQFYESGGESGSWGGGGGVEKIGTPSAAYLATFNDILHPAGL